MKRYTNVEREIERMLRITGMPRLSNGIAIDILAILQQGFDLDVAYIRDLKLRGRSVSGALVPERKLVLVEASDIPQRQRFTLAHECAHLFLDFKHAGAPSLFEDESANSFLCSPADVGELSEEAPWMKRREALANRFAAHLLMPANLCRDLFRKTRSLDGCAEALAVSKQALSIRFGQLGLTENVQQ